MIKSKIKICGIKDIETLNCCIESKINFFGLIFYNKSPRYIQYDKAVKLLNFVNGKEIFSVGVFVNENIDKLNEILKNLKVNYIQLHGTEDNDYIKYIKQKNNVKVIKTISIDNKKDFKKIDLFRNTDSFLFDYKPNKNELPGGNAKKFNWELIKDIEIKKNWFLSGGINIKNINDIKKYAIPYGIDISSGVEDKIGIKSIPKIKSLINLYGSK